MHLSIEKNRKIMKIMSMVYNTTLVFVSVCLLSIFISSPAKAGSFAQDIRTPLSIWHSSRRSLISHGEAKKEAMYETKYFTQILDHFTYTPESDTTFQQRYLINASYWGGPGAPIFLYAGNEGSVELFAQNTGFMYDIAPQFRALLVFIEHRFYGESTPFGGKQEAFRNISTAGYLSIPQALADYATFIVDLKMNLSAEQSPVVVFGGSYGGMLAAWFRLKYPHLAVGALASSAPIRIYDDSFSPYTFSNIVTNNFKSESKRCYRVIKNSWQELEKYTNTRAGLQKLQKAFRMCNDDEDVAYLIIQAFTYASMADYPTASDLFTPLPPYPVKKMCQAINNPTTGNDTLSRLYEALNIYYNYTGTTKCFRVATDDHGALPGWSWQSCMELSVPDGSDEHSMFPAYKPNVTELTEYCQKQYGVKQRPHWITTLFGVNDMKTSLKRFGSNIIFFNGLRDPCSGAGVLKSISNSLVAIVAPKGAHHVDLRFSTKDDPMWLRNIRSKEIQIISTWLKEYYNDQNSTSLQ